MSSALSPAPAAELHQSHKRTPQERERDLVFTSELYLRGYSAPQITEALVARGPYTLSVDAVRNDLAEIRKRWLETQIINFNEAQARELSRLDIVYDEAFKAWQRSQEEAVVVKSEDIYDEQIGMMKGAKLPEGIEDDQKNGVNYRYTRQKKAEERTGRDGSNVFLTTMMNCIKMRAEILGLFAPDRIEVNWREIAIKLGVEGTAQVAYDKLVRELAEAITDDPDA